MTTPPSVPEWFQPQGSTQLRFLGRIEDSMSYEERLFHHTHATATHVTCFLEFRSLRRLNLLILQNKLARLKGVISTEQKASEADWEELKNTLHDYADSCAAIAIQGFAYTNSLTDMPSGLGYQRQRDLSHAFPELATSEGAPFNSRYCTFAAPKGIPTDPIRTAVARFLPRRWTWTTAEMDVRLDEYLAGKAPLQISPIADKLARFSIALTGGLSLVVPMLVMSLPSQNRTKSLITVSVAATIFAVFLSSVVRASDFETIVSTATYAAVLVVFVGTSS